MMFSVRLRSYLLLILQEKLKENCPLHKCIDHPLIFPLTKTGAAAVWGCLVCRSVLNSDTIRQQLEDLAGIKENNERDDDTGVNESLISNGKDWGTGEEACRRNSWDQRETMMP